MSIKVMFIQLEGQHQGQKAIKDFPSSTTLKQAAIACNIPIKDMTFKCNQEALDNLDKTLQDIKDIYNTNSPVLIVRVFKKAVGGLE
ncbi:hypothetical protein TTHERM_00450850 (macronuclear) [Tetrahymena thermophila SB210]|uniref:Uncharacterized protein n=1 Tax=Tetrahymena thermophila (strain SB210) TaxID=312017 RepID=Q238T4_TETTS|nr:hypothetical protein TTHERM_00450850 [Tetrahymena thermophila SB210]EAR93136.1 hypothetical protein TTHERM_00450850 [Tetrahymena thermophila SB210]|eukprot:XP_001013381.1 hypothetical protein TTHERM_00450850 [Tetrahymena thermophila SB210]